MQQSKSLKWFAGCLVLLSSFTAVQSQATTFTWAGGGTTSFSDPANWDTNPTTPPSNTLTDLVFNNNTNTGTTVSPLTAIANPMIINTITYGASAGTFVIGGANRFSLDNGIVITNDSASDQLIATEIRASTIGSTLTLTGTGGPSGTAITTLTGPWVPQGSNFFQVAVNKTGTSTYVLTGANSSTSNLVTWTISGGVLQANSGAALATNNALALRGGVLQSDGSGSIAFTRVLGTIGVNNAVNWGAGGGGFAAGGGGTMTIRLGNGTGMGTWGTTANYLGNGTALILNSNTATGLVDWQNQINLGGGSTAFQRTITVNDNTSLSTDKARISAVINSTQAGNTLFKNGPGLLELSAANTFTGKTTVGAGTLAILSSGSLSGSVQVNPSANFDVTAVSGGFTFSGSRDLSGGGTVKGTVNIITGGSVSPGAGVGTMATDDETFGSGGVYNLDVPNLPVTPGTDYDQLQINGALHVTATGPSNQFTIKLTGPTAGFDINANYDWVIATTTLGVNPSPDAPLDSGAFAVDKTLFNDTTGSLGAGFSVGVSGSNLVLHYDGVPEPTSLGVLVLGTFGLLRRRSKRKCA